ncbi:class I SAM-dependent methyltransferase [Halocalculus aciditolerans]|uniref:Methyltransferase domain-containing protein n=1 Tax=Halocalculus aciditolerans TaxID=1383812 RepID=A0A830F7S1_9EURY|nr:class I SAM-dependent methyltransferase [Halocalculus aciditolerans]GGL47621.1 hypothetical protein GCM10009039_02300 [Halocalculus aciditolerans]
MSDGDENTWSWETFEARDFYDDLGRGEWERLDRDWYHRLEWDATVAYLEQFLPASGRVLDAGGAAGRYAVWLAERGYDVTLVDVSETQLDIARAELDARGLRDRVTVHVGDVRDLAYESDTFDATLCLGGPLSHVTDADERATAARELARVTDPGAPVFASVMGRLALVQAKLQQGDELALLPDLARDGTYDAALLREHGVDSPSLFAAHFFRVDELEALLETAGLDVETVAGLEGVASLRRTADGDVGDLDAEKRDAARETVDALREDRSVADFSTHILAVATVARAFK